jgi:hypothetical protein
MRRMSLVEDEVLAMTVAQRRFGASGANIASESPPLEYRHQIPLAS